MKPHTASRYLAGIICLLQTPGINAHDLVLQDAKVITVSPCDRQIRLTVRHDLAGHSHPPGKADSGPYRIAITSLTRKKTVMEFPVEGHKPGETLYFVVPSSKLSCDSSVKVVVDSGNTVVETNENNNDATEKLVRPKSTGLIETCPVNPESCK
jgi:hypothetical protein